MRKLISRFDDVFGGHMLDRATKDLQGSFDSLFNGGLWNDLFGGGTLGTFPKIIDDGATRHYEFDVPGANKEILQADLDKNVLTISYENKSGKVERSGRYLYVLPPDVDLDDTPVLTLKDGILTVTVSTKQVDQPKPPTRRKLTIL